MGHKIAVMQPYFFPYIGYFQLIAAVEKFVFYDDVNFIKQGWINRNRILINGQPQYITVELIKASPNRLIKEIEVGTNKDKILRTLTMAYKKAPHFDSIWPIIEECMSTESQYISELAINSVQLICRYLGLKVDFEVSSTKYADTKPLDRSDRLIEICKQSQATHYINAMGGRDLYDKAYFMQKGIKLYFLSPEITSYRQFDSEFVPALSILDTLMFNDIEAVKQMLRRYLIV